MAFRSKASVLPALLAMSVAQASFAATIVGNTGTDITSGGSNVVVIGSTTPPQVTFGLNSVNASGNFYSQQTGTATSGQQVFYFSGANATPIQTGSAIDYTQDLNTQTYATNPVNSSNPTISAPVVNETAVALGSNGDVIGYQLRGFNTQANFGTDGYLYTPATNTTTVLGDQGVLAVTNSSNTYTGTLTSVNTYSGTVFYSFSYTATTKIGQNFNVATQPVTQLYRSATPVAVNSADEVAGSVNRYTGVSATATATGAIGTDAFLYNPNDPTAPVTIIGLMGGADSYTTSKTSGLNTYNYAVVNNKSVALNSSGAVIGTSARYQSAVSASSAGQDVWLYTSTGGTQQIGLVGAGAHPTAVGSVNEYYSPVISGAYTQQSSSVLAINGDGTIAGTTVVYASPTSSTSLGQEAWVYSPAAGGGTGTGYGTSGAGTYTQVGLTSIVGQTASTATNPVSGYTSTSGLHTSAITVLSSTGNAVGTSARYYSDSTSSLGNDAYFYSASTGISTKITPASSALSNYITSAGISQSSGLYLNNGSGSSAVAAGLQTRYSPGTTGSVGNDAFAYVDGNAYVIASPAILAGMSAFSSLSSDFTNTEYFTSSVNGITDNGEVVGYLSAYTGSTSSSTLIGTYYFVWTLDGGTTLLTSTTRTALVDPLSSSTAFSSLNAFQVYIDGAGNVYGTTGSFNGGSHPFEILASVPEPASLGLFASSGLVLLRRRSKR